jgi:hypothetical protein
MKIMSALLTIGFCLVLLAAGAESRTDSLLRELNATIAKREVYLKEKQERIARYTTASRHAKDAALFDLYLKIYEEYKSFIYDSAFTYARKLQDIAYRTKNPIRITQAKLKSGFVLVSSGLFLEALDTLRSIRPAGLPDSTRQEYNYLMARTCYDLSDFDRDDFYSRQYTERGTRFMDSALLLTPPNSAHYKLLQGLKSTRLRDMRQAQQAFEEMISGYKVSDTDFAVAASTLSFIYFYSDQLQKSKEMLIRAAIADIRASTKETLATLNLADMLYKEGDIEGAYKYVKVAMEDANFYGARHRKVQIAAVYPIIEGKQLNIIESRRRMLFLYSTVITVLTLMTIVFAVIIYKQFQRLQIAKKTISEANDVLTETNHQLGDANKIKEEYIWYYFTTTAEYINKIDVLKKSLEMKLMTKKLEDLRFTVESINIKKEREELYHNFDMVFLKLFPDFVTIFNSFFNEEDRIHLKEDQLLNTELRIFALIRMGIHDNEKIAKILDYSVTTIYTYKTRIRNKSILPNEVFEKKIMAIRAI